MRLFNTVSLEIGSRCNRTCWFCPNGHNTRPDEFMAMGLINSIAHELQTLSYSGRVELYMYNEPFLDDRLLDIISTFRKLVPRSCIMIATNADYVRRFTQFQDLFDAGLNQLQVNVYSNVPRYRKLLEMLQNTTAISGNIYSYLAPKHKVYSLEQKFDRLVTPETPKVGRFELSNRSGNVPGLEMLPTNLDKVCARPFRFMQLNWKGEVVICCNDYHGKVICGDANKESLQHIWELSPVYKKYRTQLLQSDRTGLPLCAPCSFKGGSYLHLLPSCWTELL